MGVYLPKVKGEEFFQIFSTDVDEVGVRHRFDGVKDRQRN
jgi:hypothetical protein